MNAILYVGDFVGVNPEYIEKLSMYGLEMLSFSSIEGLMPYLDVDYAKMILIRVESIQDHVKMKESIKTLNNTLMGRIPIVMVTDQDNVDFRQEYMDLSFVHFFQFYDQGMKLKASFERLLMELDIREQMRHLRFAVIDDDKLQLHALKKLFDRHGIDNVAFFSHPSEFEDSNQAFDVYLIDLVMPYKSGDELIFEIRKAHSDAVILAVSSLETTDVIATVLSLGANDFIVKPYNETIFMAKIMSNSRLRYLMKENRKKTEELEEMALRDPMTNLYNHRRIQTALAESVMEYQAGKGSFSVIMMDIDHFKKINDSHGHQTGDEVLMAMAELIRGTIGSKGIVGRYGGEEFVAILPGVSESEAGCIAESIRHKTEQKRLCINIDVTISMGVAEISPHVTNVIEAADRMLYKAKDMGRNRVVRLHA